MAIKFLGIKRAFFDPAFVHFIRRIFLVHSQPQIFKEKK